jgi:ABC-type dipeptide/oligopeptide/nickel transport system permease component
MTRLLLRRLVWMVVVIWGVVTLTFVISHLVPADPARLAAGVHAGPAQVASVRKQFGLDKPVYVQYVIYVKGVLQGNLGTSLVTRRPVLQDLLDYWPATIELTLFALFVYVVVGIPAGIISAVYRDSPLDQGTRVAALFGASMPAFWFGLLLQLLFGKDLGWFPLDGRLGLLSSPPPHVTGLYVLDSLLTGHWQDFIAALHHLVMPGITLGLTSIAFVMRLSRASLLEIIGRDYIRTARAKGLSPFRTVVVHGFRNAMFPIITLTGLQIGSLMGGAVLVEDIFDWPGIGRYALQSVERMDFPAIMGVTLGVSVVYVVVNLVVDLVYMLVDPRIRYD